MKTTEKYACRFLEILFFFLKDCFYAALGMSQSLICYAAFTPKHMSPGNILMYPGRATCIRIHICRRTHVVGYMLLVRDTCWLYLGDIITIHLCHGRLVSICIQQSDGRQTGDNFVADTRNMLTATSGYKWIQLVSGNMCLGVNAA